MTRPVTRVPWPVNKRLASLLFCLSASFLFSQTAWAGWAHQTTSVNTEKVSDGSISVTLAATVETGRLLVVGCTTDNPDTTDGATTHYTVTDSQSNSYTRAIEQQRGSPGASAGILGSVWYSTITTQLSTSDTVTCTIDTAVTGKAISASEYSFTEPSVTLAGSNASLASTSAPSTTLSGLSSAEYLWFGLTSFEHSNAQCTSGDADYTSRSGCNGTSGGGGATNATGWQADRVFTGTSDTYAVTLGAATDVANFLVAFQESGGGPQPQAPLRRQVIARALPAPFQPGGFGATSARPIAGAGTGPADQ